MSVSLRVALGLAVVCLAAVGSAESCVGGSCLAEEEDTVSMLSARVQRRDEETPVAEVPEVKEQCVAGMLSTCKGKAVRWTGSECCLPDHWTCTAGTIAGCNGRKQFWTGTLCCITAPKVCTAGLEAPCTGIFTGTRCCLPPTKTCVAGTIADCNGPRSHWTGTYCCVDDYQKCYGSGPEQCMGADTTFTGTQCCLPQAFTCVSSGENCKANKKQRAGGYCCNEALQSDFLEKFEAEVESGNGGLNDTALAFHIAINKDILAKIEAGTIASENYVTASNKIMEAFAQAEFAQAANEAGDSDFLEKFAAALRG